MLTEYRPLLLADDHPTSRYVRRIIGRIVEKNGLGTMKGEQKRSSGAGWGWGPTQQEGLDRDKGQEEVEWEVRPATSSSLARSPENGVDMFV